MRLKKRKRLLIALSAAALCAGVALVLLFAFGVLGEMSMSLPPLAPITPLKAGEILPPDQEEFEEIARRGELSLWLRPSDGNFYVETASGARWYANPTDALDDSYATRVYKMELASSLIISYIDLEDRMDVKKNSEAACVRKDNLTLSRVENGFRAEYYFKDGGIRVPVEITLGEGYLNARVVTDAVIEERPDEFLLGSIRLLPNFGWGGAQDEGYVLLPDGQGALMDFHNGKGGASEYKAAVYGDSLSASLVFRPTDARAVSLPVFGIKKNDSAFLAVLTGGDESAYVCAAASETNSSYCGAYAEYRLRFSDRYMLDSSSKLAQTVTLYQQGGMEIPACEQRYYFLSGADADYNGMAARYRRYLIEEGGVPERAPDETLLFIDYYAAVTRRESVLGVPVDRQEQLSSLAEIEREYLALRDVVPGGIRLRVRSWSSDALKGLTDTDPDWAAGNDWRMWERLRAAVEGAGDSLSLSNDYLRFTARGNGVVPIRDAAKALSRSPAFQYVFSLATRMQNENAKRGYLLHPALLTGGAERLSRSLSGRGVPSLSLLSLASVRYGSYDTNSAFPAQMIAAATEALGILSEKYSLVLESANAYALPYAEYVASAPSGDSGYNLTDRTVPFLQMVYGGLVGFAGGEANLRADSRAALLDAVSSGGALHYALVTGDEERLIDTDLNNLYSASSADWTPAIIAAANELMEARRASGHSRLIGFEWIAEGVSVSAFENGAAICVNRNASPVEWAGAMVPAKGFAVRGEALE